MIHVLLMQHYDVMVISLPTVPLHLHLVVGDEFLGAFLGTMARVRPDGGADELIAPEEEIIALSVGIASSPHTNILHQSKVADLGEEHGRGEEGKRGEGREEHGRGGKGGPWQSRGGGAWEGREGRTMAE